MNSDRYRLAARLAAGLVCIVTLTLVSTGQTVQEALGVLAAAVLCLIFTLLARRAEVVEYQRATRAWLHRRGGL